MNSRKVGVVVSIICIIGLLAVCGCATKPQAAAAKKPSGISPYEMKVEPLTTAECGQCHFSYFETISAQGGKHQIDCVQCHTVYHAYSPRKKNYDQIMPKCSSCHLNERGEPFHGKDKSLTPCLNCHADPHKPLQIPASEVEPLCARCHAKEGNEINEYRSKHTTEVSCSDCHAEKHGYIPECGACHESHSPSVELSVKDCMACHPVHKPTQIFYGKETPSAICAGCHDDVNNMLQTKVTKHTAVRCAECHPAHKEIPPCTRCHGEPHPKSMMINVAKCGTCHGIAHDLAQ